MKKGPERNEIVYQMVMSTAYRMLQNRVISEEEYVKFDTKMQAKYAPKFGTLFTDINLR